MANEPQFLGIGATKAGTTWLHHMLSGHPEVTMPVIKELHYFDSLESERTRRWTQKYVRKELRRVLAGLRQGEDVPANKALRRYVRSLLLDEFFTEQWYARMFARPDRRGSVSGEITPAYAELPDHALSGIDTRLPGVRIIYLARHPVDRVVSHLQMSVALRSRDTDESSLHALLDRSDEVFSRGAAEQYLPRWERVFGSDRVLVLPYGLIKRDPVRLLRSVEQHLGLSSSDHYEVDLVANRSNPIEIPESVLERIAETVAPTIDFLAERYGASFLGETQ